MQIELATQGKASPGRRLKRFDLKQSIVGPARLVLVGKEKAVAGKPAPARKAAGNLTVKI